jgi:hypothetical protein
MGRGFRPDEDSVPGRDAVAVIGHDTWQSEFASSSDVIGHSIFVNGIEFRVSRPGESHPEPLSEPYLNLSAHTAPAMEPRRTPSCRCAHNFGSRLEIRATQCVALRKWPRSFLYFR